MLGDITIAVLALAPPSGSALEREWAKEGKARTAVRASGNTVKANGESLS